MKCRFISKIIIAKNTTTFNVKLKKPGSTVWNWMQLVNGSILENPEILFIRLTLLLQGL